MKEEVSKFIDRIKNYKMIRSTDYKTEYELQKLWHKKRINECYVYLKYLTLRKDSLSLLEEYKAVSNLTKEVEQSYLNWRKNVKENN